MVPTDLGSTYYITPINLKTCSLSLSTNAPKIPTRVSFTKIRADWLKNADVTEIVSQFGITEDIFYYDRLFPEEYTVKDHISNTKI